MTGFCIVGHKRTAGNNGNLAFNEFVDIIEHINIIGKFCPNEQAALRTNVCDKAVAIFIEAVAHKVELMLINFSDIFDMSIYIVFIKPTRNNHLIEDAGMNIGNLFADCECACALFGNNGISNTDAGCKNF